MPPGRRPLVAGIAPICRPHAVESQTGAASVETAPDDAFTARAELSRRWMDIAVRPDLCQPPAHSEETDSAPAPSWAQPADGAGQPMPGELSHGHAARRPAQPDTGPGAPVQRYALTNDGKVSNNKKLIASTDKKRAFVRADSFDEVKGALDQSNNAKITLTAGPQRTFESAGNTAYVAIIPKMAEGFAAAALEPMLELYQDIQEYLDTEHENGEGVVDEPVDVPSDNDSGHDSGDDSGQDDDGGVPSYGREQFDRFVEQERAGDAPNLVVPLDCGATAHHLLKEVSKETKDDPAVADNYFMALNNNVQGTLLSALKGWNFHYAAVIAKDSGDDNTDNLAFETGAQGFAGEIAAQLIDEIAEHGDMDALLKYGEFLMSTVYGATLGEFEMYGTERPEQTFSFLTYARLFRQMLDQVGLQVDAIVHDIQKEQDKTGNIETIDNAMMMLGIKLDTLRESHPGDKVKERELIREHFSTLELETEIDPETAPLAMLLMASMFGSQQGSDDSRLQEEMPQSSVVSDHEDDQASVSNEDVDASVDESSHEAKNDDLVYTKRVKSEIVNVLKTSVIAFAERRQDVDTLAEDHQEYQRLVGVAKLLEKELTALSDSVTKMPLEPDMDPNDDDFDAEAYSDALFANLHEIRQALFTRLGELKTLVQIG